MAEHGEKTKKERQKSARKAGLSIEMNLSIGETVMELLGQWGDSVAKDPLAFGEKVRAEVEKLVAQTGPSSSGRAPGTEDRSDADTGPDSCADSTTGEREDFWDLGKPKPRIYKAPDFREGSLSVTDVENDTALLSATEAGSVNAGERAAQSEKIPPRESYSPADSMRVRSSSGTGRVVNTVSGPRCVNERVVTSSYRRKSISARTVPAQNRKQAETVKTYTPEGMLIRSVSVRTWESDTEFYGRFASDARLSHKARPSTPAEKPFPLVPYFSYVPQYAHMNRAQVEYYRWLRENIRLGRYPETALSYLQLCMFEIINLPDEIPPKEGSELLAGIWLNYRRDHPRIDTFLCEWMADYCLIGGCPMPSALAPILPQIVPKAQFKEFYLNNWRGDEKDSVSMGRTVMEVSSDYDYQSSRYYKENAEAYEAHIPAALTFALKQAKAEQRGIFAMDRVYKMTRDSYCGAIIASGIKRRIDLEFLSFTRRADTRTTVTAMVKYAENKLRGVLGIKAKLSATDLDPADMALLDRYFEPLLPVKQKASKEDLYMPADYMKNYESEDSGFDFSRALEIEASSWANTGRLTGEDLTTAPTAEPEEELHVEGEIASDCILPPDDKPSVEKAPPMAPAAATAQPREDTQLREALRAALLGEFRLYCRKKGLYEGELADRINTLFLEELGDVVLESTDGGFTLIEDYREDIENWLL